MALQADDRKTSPWTARHAVDVRSDSDRLYILVTK